MVLNKDNKKIVDEWNKKYGKSVPVRYYYSDDPDEYEFTSTKSKVFLTRKPYPEILLEGHVKLVNLLKLKPVVENE